MGSGSSSAALPDRLSEADCKSLVGILHNKDAFKAHADHEGMVRRSFLVQEAQRRKLPLQEHGFVLFENLRSFKRCRAGIQTIADGCLRPDGPLQSIAWRGEEGVMGNVEFQQRRLDGAGPARTLDELYEVAEAALPVFEDLVRSVANGIGAAEAVGVAPLKGRDRAQAKADNEYDKQPSPAVAWLFDVVRGRCIFKTEDAIADFFAKFDADERVVIVRVKNRFNPPEFNGYRDMLLNLRVEVRPGVWHMCELQIHHEQIKESDLIYKSHITYEYFRRYFVGNKDAVAERLAALEGLPVEEVESIGALVDLVLERDAIASQLHQLVKLLDMMSQLELAGRVRRRLVEQSGAEEGGEETAAHAVELNNLAQLLKAQGKLDEAEAPMKQALAIFKKVLGEEHPNVATLLNNLAQLLKAQGKLDEAVPLYEQSLAIKRKIHGEEHPSVATGLNNLAQLLSAQGKLEEAMDLQQQAFAIRKKVLGMEHPLVASDLNNLAQLLSAQGKYDEAVTLTEQSLAIRKKVYGEEHPSVATGLNNLAQLLSDQGKYDEAEPLYKQALAIDKKVYGEDHPDVAIDLNNLALLLKAQGKLDEAEPLMKQALAIDKKVYGEDHPDVAIDLNNLAQLLKKQGKLDEAEPLYKQAIAIWKKVHGEEHPQVATGLNNLAQLLSDQGKLDEAEAPMKQALAIFKKVLGEEHPNVATLLNNLAQLLKAQGKLDEAEPLMKQALAIDKKIHGEDHPDVACGLNNLARC